MSGKKKTKIKSYKPTKKQVTRSKKNATRGSKKPKKGLGDKAKQLEFSFKY